MSIIVVKTLSANVIFDFADAPAERNGLAEPMTLPKTAVPQYNLMPDRPILGLKSDPAAARIGARVFGSSCGTKISPVKSPRDD